MGFFKKLFGKSKGDAIDSPTPNPQSRKVFASQAGKDAYLRNNCKFIDHVIEGIQVVSFNTSADGTYEVYNTRSRTTALRFLRSIRPGVIPLKYYVVVETPEGNFGRDILSIYEESTGMPISMHERLVKVNLGEIRPDILIGMINTGKSASIKDSLGNNEIVSVEDMKCGLKAIQIMQEADEHGRAENYDDARESYFRFISEANFEDDVAFYSLAGVSAMLGYVKEAKGYLKKALLINPSNKKAAELLDTLQSD